MRNVKMCLGSFFKSVVYKMYYILIIIYISISYILGFFLFFQLIYTLNSASSLRIKTLLSFQD